MIKWLVCLLWGHRWVKRSRMPVSGDVERVVYRQVPWCLWCGKANPRWDSLPGQTLERPK
jgi:hypothetical protein